MRGLLMKFERRSKTLLAVTKAKAKMYEFSLPEAEHIELKQPPSSLLIMTISMLGDLCRQELARDNNTDEAKQALEESKAELRNAARYFDALNDTKLEPSYTYYLSLLASSAYYLADMPGSSLILINKAQSSKSQLSESGLEEFLDWLLLNQYHTPYVSDKESEIQEDIAKFTDLISRFFGFQDLSAEKLLQVSEDLRVKIYEEGSDRELLIVDVICSIVKKRVANSSIIMLPKVTEIPLKDWAPALAKDTFIKEFWPAQRLLAEKDVFKGSSAVVQLPTSAGKTKSSELIIRSAFLSNRAHLVILVAPFRSLCREITDAFSLAFSNENVNVNQLNDLPQIDAWDEEVLNLILDAASLADMDFPNSIIVSTPEKLVYLLRHMSELKDEIGLLIFDEGHQFDTGARGVTYELLLANLKRSVAPGTQTILISAVISNATSIGDWLYGDNGTVVDGASCLSTERSIAFSSWKSEKGQLHYVNPAAPDEEEYFVPRVLEQTMIPLRGRERKQRFFPDKADKSSIASYLAFKLSEQGPVAIFCGTKKIVSSICKKMLDAQDRLPTLTSPASQSNAGEIERLHYLAKLHFSEEYHLVKAIQVGILPHSSSVPNGLRTAIEYAMEHSMARCVICTSTLAQGVNLPIKYLVISGVFQGKKRISTRDFHNLIGRAGRSGKHTEGTIIFSDSELFDNRGYSTRWQWGLMKQLLDPSQSEHCVSSLKTLVEFFHNDYFGIDPIDFVRDPKNYKEEYLKLAEQDPFLVSEIADRDPYLISEIAEMLNQMKVRESYIHSIESYLLALPEVSDESVTTEEILSILQDTLAFHMASDDEKDKLITVFQNIFLQVSAVPVEKRAAYGKALLGIDVLQQLENWILSEFEQLITADSIETLLEKIWPILVDAIDSPYMSKIRPVKSILNIAKSWIIGSSYHELMQGAADDGVAYQTATKSTALSTDQIIDFCDNVLGYQVMLVVGAIADLIEAMYEDAEVVEKIRHLQAALKLGFNSQLEHWLHSKGFIDRELCKEVKVALVKAGYVPEASMPDNLIVAEKELFKKVLHKYPAYFSNQVKGLL